MDELVPQSGLQLAINIFWCLILVTWLLWEWANLIIGRFHGAMSPDFLDFLLAQKFCLNAIFTDPPSREKLW